jgi:hypothetical protein
VVTDAEFTDTVGMRSVLRNGSGVFEVITSSGGILALTAGAAGSAFASPLVTLVDVQTGAPQQELRRHKLSALRALSITYGRYYIYSIKQAHSRRILDRLGACGRRESAGVISEHLGEARVGRAAAVAPRVRKRRPR